MKLGINYLFVVFLFLQLPSSGQQKNYLKVRDSLYSVTCGQVNSSDVFQSMRRLEAYDTLLIKRYMDQYYIDLGTIYWLASNGQDNNYLQKSIRSNHKALYHNPQNPTAYWNLAFAYSIIQDCGKVKSCLSSYKSNLSKKWWTDTDEQQEKVVLQNCDK